MKKEKFGLLNFGSVEVLSKEEMKKVTGGYGWNTANPNPGFSVRYVLRCDCEGPNGYQGWEVPEVEYAGCSTLSAGQFTCRANIPSSVSCYDRGIYPPATC